MNRIVAIVPARGGSKGIPRKNIKSFCGKPLVSYIIRAALKVPQIDRVIVSTEDMEIAEISKKYGAEVPFVRPIELASDDTPTMPVLQHAIKYLEEIENYFPSLIILLYPTSPLLSSDRINEAIEILKKDELDSLISVVEDKGHFWIKNKHYTRLYPKIVKNRQYVDPLYRENGGIYLFTRNLIMEKNKITGGNVGFIIMENNESIDIDTNEDFEFAEFQYKKKFQKGD